MHAGFGLASLVTKRRDRSPIGTMATLNTRNVHRSNMLMGFPYGTEFVYDEMVLTGPAENGEAAAKAVVAANSGKTEPHAPKPGEGPTKQEREAGSYDLLFVRRARCSSGNLDARSCHAAQTDQAACQSCRVHF
jgi:short subunit dehydrogenase-like uncharacterized protein